MQTLSFSCDKDEATSSNPLTVSRGPQIPVFRPTECGMYHAQSSSVTYKISHADKHPELPEKKRQDPWMTAGSQAH